MYVISFPRRQFSPENGKAIGTTLNSVWQILLVVFCYRLRPTDYWFLFENDYRLQEILEIPNGIFLTQYSFRMSVKWTSENIPHSNV